MNSNGTNVLAAPTHRDKTSATRSRSLGSNSASNEGFRRSQRLFLGLRFPNAPVNPDPTQGPLSLLFAHPESVGWYAQGGDEQAQQRVSGIADHDRNEE